MYRDSSLAPLLDMRRRFKAVMDALGAMIRYGVSFSRSVELTAQWDRILFHRVVSDVYHRLSDFIHSVVIHRRDEAIRGWRNWIREDPIVHPCKWLRPGLVPQLHFSGVSPF